jgi:5-oxoprolinase (ATP-hydrolysing)
MKHIQNTAEQSVRNLMKELSAKNSCNPTDTFVHLKEQEYMDDGSIINLYARINKSDGSALFDFTGTTYQVNGNSNAPRAITLSAIIYCLRCMLNYEIPLNQVEIFLDKIIFRII